MMKEELKKKTRLTASSCAQEDITPICLQSLAVLNCTAVMWLGGLILYQHCLELQGKYIPLI